MKNHVFWIFFILFFLTVFGISAQMQYNTVFYTLPISGSGGRAIRNHIRDRMNFEIAFQDYGVLFFRQGSDYVFSGRISKVDNEDEDIEEFELTVKMMLTRTNKLIDEKSIIFSGINDETDLKIAQMMHEFFTDIRDDSTDEDDILIATPPREETGNRFFFRYIDYGWEFSEDWRDMLFYFDYSILWIPRENYYKNYNKDLFDINLDDMNYLNLGLNLSFSFQFLPFMALEAGFQFIQETTWGEEYRDLIFEHAYALKFILKPFNNLMMELYCGITLLNSSTMNAIIPSPYNLFVGLDFNINTNSGIFVIDPRFGFDLTDSSIIDSTLEYRRRLFQLGLGYKHGFVPKLVKIKEKI